MSKASLSFPPKPSTPQPTSIKVGDLLVSGDFPGEVVLITQVDDCGTTGNGLTVTVAGNISPQGVDVMDPHFWHYAPSGATVSFTQE